jgi:tetratricopeptide (TPR) repeat protein
MNLKFLLFVVILSSLSLFTKAQNDLSVLFASGQYSQTIQLAENILATDSTRFDGWYYRAMSQSALYRYSMAIGSFQKALKYTNDSIPVLFLLAQTCDNAGNRQDALEFYQSVILKDSSYVPAKARLAAIYLNQRNYLKAIELYSSLIKNDTTNSYFYSRLAYACNQLGLTPAAIEYYNQAIQLNNEDAESAAKLLEIYMDVKFLFPEADSVADTLLALFPNQVDLLKNKACIRSTLGDFPGAIALFQQVVEMGDSSLFTCQNYGNTLFNNSNYPEAIYWLRRYASERPDNTDNLYVLALACQRDYRYQESLNLFDSVLMQIYNKVNIARTVADRAQTYKIYGDYLNFRDSVKSQAKVMYQLSLDDLNQTIDLDPKRAETYLKLANLYELQLHNLQMALKYYEKYLQVLPPPTGGLDRRDWLENKIRSLKEELHFKGE